MSELTAIIYILICTALLPLPAPTIERSTKEESKKPPLSVAIALSNRVLLKLSEVTTEPWASSPFARHSRCNCERAAVYARYN